MKKLEIQEGDFKALAHALRKVDFFSSFTLENLDLLLPHFELYEFKSGETIFKKGDPGDALYIIHEGKVSIRLKEGFFSSTKTLATLTQGNFFGEMALLDKAPRTATVVVDEKSKLFVLLGTYFDDVMKKNPKFNDEVKRIAEHRRFETHYKSISKKE